MGSLQVGKVLTMEHRARIAKGLAWRKKPEVQFTCTGCGKPFFSTKYKPSKPTVFFCSADCQKQVVKARFIETCGRMNAGRKLTEEHKEKLSVAHAGIKQNLTTEQREVISIRAKKYLKPIIKHWKIRSPQGVIYEFDNAYNFARENSHLFSLTRPSYNLKWMLVANGIQGICYQEGKSKVEGSYYGWTSVSLEEAKHGEEDLLGRELVPLVGWGT